MSLFKNQSEPVYHEPVTPMSCSSKTVKAMTEGKLLPAFLDTLTGDIYLSRYPNGELSPLHRLDGLPKHLLCALDECDQAYTLKNTVSSGFCKDGCFYTYAQARRMYGHCSNHD